MAVLTQRRNKSLTPGDAPASKVAAFHEEKRAEALREVEAARAIADTAATAGREMTDPERKAVESHLAKSDNLGLQMERAKEAAAGRASMQEIASLFGANDIAPDREHKTTSGAPLTKAEAGRRWGAAVVRQCSDTYGRFKGLTPSGTTLVDVPAPEPVAFGRPVTSLRSLIPAAPCSGAYAFLRQTVRTNNAAPVAPGALKPESVYTFERVEDRARTLAHLSQSIPRQDLSDAPLLRDFVEAEMFFGLEQELEDQILSGNGVGENLLGLNSTSGVQTVALVGATAHEKLLTLRRGITRLEIVGLVGSGYVMNPNDWEAVESLATTDGTPIMQGAGQTVPVDAAARRLYGLPVVATVACPAGTVWLADWTGSTRLYVREEARLDWSENTYRPDALGVGVGASDWARNLIAFRAEGRFGFAVLRPSGVVKISLV